MFFVSCIVMQLYKVNKRELNILYLDILYSLLL